GINERVRGLLKNLIEIFVVINKDQLQQNDILKEIKRLHPYYDFILDVEDYQLSEEFDINWLLENQSEIVLKKIAINKDIKRILKEELNKSYHKELGHIFIKYFSD
ncbi:MAG: hypothetical protein ABFS35_20395, partial [Bacteroidota bacterium]